MDWNGRSGSITLALTRSLAMIASMVAASTHRATWPRTRSSVQWKIGLNSKKSFNTEKADQDAFKADWWEVFDKIEEPPGERAVGEARRRIDGFRAQWERAHPAAVACLVEDFESLTVHLRFPKEHWRRCRHTNLIERTFGETRRRTKVIGRLPGERACVALVFAVLDRQRRGWRGVTVTPRALKRLQDLRRELLEEQQDPDSEETVTAAA